MHIHMYIYRYTPSHPRPSLGAQGSSIPHLWPRILHPGTLQWWAPEWFFAPIPAFTACYFQYFLPSCYPTSFPWRIPPYHGSVYCCFRLCLCSPKMSCHIWFTSAGVGLMAGASSTGGYQSFWHLEECEGKALQKGIGRKNTHGNLLTVIFIYVKKPV